MDRILRGAERNTRVLPRRDAARGLEVFAAVGVGRIVQPDAAEIAAVNPVTADAQHTAAVGGVVHFDLVRLVRVDLEVVVAARKDIVGASVRRGRVARFVGDCEGLGQAVVTVAVIVAVPVIGACRAGVCGRPRVHIKQIAVPRHRLAGQRFARETVGCDGHGVVHVGDQRFRSVAAAEQRAGTGVDVSVGSHLRLGNQGKAVHCGGRVVDLCLRRGRIA